MRTGVAYLGHHNPRHLSADLRALRDLGCADVLLATQEIDFDYYPGKHQFLPPAAKDLGLRPVLILWGALNLFGGGRSSQFLLDHPEAHQVRADGSWHPAGCYNHPAAAPHIESLIGRALAHGFAGYFIDEPPPLDCYCPSCRELFAEGTGEDLGSAPEAAVSAFRRRCVTDYVARIARHVKEVDVGVETFCCIPPEHRDLWPEAAAVPGLDNLGTDLYWANTDEPAGEVRGPAAELAGLCARHGKGHHQWLQCWGVEAGREGRIGDLGRALSATKPDALYVWAYEGQVGTNETCADPPRAWAEACAVLREVGSLGNSPVARP